MLRVEQSRHRPKKPKKITCVFLNDKTFAIGNSDTRFSHSPLCQHNSRQNRFRLLFAFGSHSRHLYFPEIIASIFWFAPSQTRVPPPSLFLSPDNVNGGKKIQFLRASSRVRVDGLTWFVILIATGWGRSSYGCTKFYSFSNKSIGLKI